MRTLLGRVVAITIATGSVLGVASLTTSPAGAVTEPTTAAPPTTTTTTVTADTGAPVVVVPDTAGVASRADGVYEAAEVRGRTPDRGGQVQVAATAPPPTTAPPPWALPTNSGEGRRVVYSKTRQRVWAVEEDGSVAHTHLVSGRTKWNQPTPNNLSRTGIEPEARYYSDPPAFYRVFSRSAYTCALKTPYICWRYMIRFTKGGDRSDNIGFHEIPVDNRTGYRLQSESQLGTPLSDGCVRQGTADAEFMWNWAWKYTKVVVLP